MDKNAPDILYHATFRAHLDSIFRYGLGAKQEKNWEISNDGIVCLAEDKYCAESFAECAEDAPDKVYDSGIVVLQVDCRGLSLIPDQNISSEADLSCWQYRGVIAPNKLVILERGI